MRITPINMAEAIIDPFWDPQLSGFKEWQIESGSEHGLQVSQNWCWVSFEWTRKPASGPALYMSRDFNLDCTGYDRLMVSIMSPERSIFRMTAITDQGSLVFEAPPAPPLKKEYYLDLQGATHLYAVTLEIEATQEGIAAGWLNWVGLQNSELLSRHQAQWSRFDERWEPYLKPESYEPHFEPAFGLLMNKEELSAFRSEHAAFLAKHGESPFTKAAKEAGKHIPEKMIGDFVNFGGDTRYCRERDYGKILLGHGVNAAIGGLLLKDKRLLRLAARYAMSLAMCGRWDDGMICYFPGSNFEHRCFVQSLCVHEVSLLLDLAGEMFTDTGRQYLLRRIAEEGIGSINFNTWKHEYIFHCNQLAWFTPGRMLGYAILEKFMPRVRPYMEMAYQDLIENLNHTILPDGGYVEGPSYFRCVARDGGLSLYYYARARGQDLKAVIPDIMKRTTAFVEALTSTDASTDVIPICDASALMEQETLAVMAAILPESHWVTMFHKSLSRTDRMPGTVFAWKLMKAIPEKAPETGPFILLPQMGVMASVRRVGGQTVKLLIMGNKAGAGHTHEDKGSFVLEFAGETFAMDPGTCDYSSHLADILKNCERHNMLVPAGMPERPHPQCPLPMDVRPQGEGDDIRFHARIDATPGWENYYRRWMRAWNSPAPDTLIIRDEYELARGSAVEFYWNTKRKVRIEDGMIILTGERGKVTIPIPKDCSARVEVLPLLHGDSHRRIAIRKEGISGSLEITVKLVEQEE